MATKKTTGEIALSVSKNKACAQSKACRIRARLRTGELTRAQATAMWAHDTTMQEVYTLGQLLDTNAKGTGNGTTVVKRTLTPEEIAKYEQMAAEA